MVPDNLILLEGIIFDLYSLNIFHFLKYKGLVEKSNKNKVSVYQALDFILSKL